MATLRWTAEAEQWLKDIFDYIALENPQAANKVVSGIYQKAQILESFPDIGYNYRTEPEALFAFYFMGIIGAYIIQDETIDILGVFHGALDIDRYFP